MLLAPMAACQRCSRATSAGARACAPPCKAWGLEIQCADPAVYSPVLTGVMMPEGIDADAVRQLIYERFDLSLGTGLGKVKGRMFRMGHLGDSNDLTLMATLAGVRDGPEALGREARGQRRAGGDGLLRRPRRRRPRCRRRPECRHVDSKQRRHHERRLHPGRGRRRGRPGAPRCARRNGRPARCASWSASRRAAAPTCWPAWIAQKLSVMWNRRSSSRTRAASPASGRRVCGTQPGDGSTLLMAHINSHAHRAQPAASCATTPSATSCRSCWSASRPTC